MKILCEIAATAFVGIAAWLSIPVDARAGEVQQVKAEPDKIGKWEGFERRDFKVDGRNCLLVVPVEPAQGKPWIWRTEFFGHQPQADLALLHKGFHVAYMDVQNMYGAPVALDHMDKFYEHLTAVRGLAPKTVLEGFSRGGLFALNWAARHPDRVACVYNDAPVCDFKSWPGGKGKGKGSPGDWRQCLKVYGLTEQQALEYKLNPVDNLEGLAKAKVPLLHVCGDADDVVPIDENTRLVEKRYRESRRADHGHRQTRRRPSSAQPGESGADRGLRPEAHHRRARRPHHAGVAVRLSRVSTPELGRRTDPAARPARGRRTGSCAVASSATATDGNAPAVVRDWQPVVADLVEGPVRRRDHGPRGRLVSGRIAAGAERRNRSRRPRSNTSASAKCSSSPANRTRPTTAPRSKRRPAAWWPRSTASSGFLPTIRNRAFRTAAGGGSFLPAFGDALYEKYRVPIGVASTGAGATSVREWLPRGERMKNQPTTGAHVRPVGPREWECTGTLYDGLMKRIDGPRPARLPGGALAPGRIRRRPGSGRLSGRPADHRQTVRRVHGEAHPRFPHRAPAGTCRGSSLRLPTTARRTRRTTNSAPPKKPFGKMASRSKGPTPTP